MLNPDFRKYLPLILVVGIFAFGFSAQAGLESAVLTVVSLVVAGIINVIATIISLVLEAIIFLAEYNDYAYATPVVIGWRIIRDLCNMMFILVVLVIAFATILHYEKYSIKQLLTKVVLMAILINFSKTICALILDVSGVVMLTFVAGFKELGGSGITALLGIDAMLKMTGATASGDSIRSADPGSLDPEQVIARQAQPKPWTFWDVLLVYTLALVYMLVALVTLISMLGILVTRMIMIWIYIIISPMAYFASILPHTASVSSKWWNKFSSYVMTGPILAFFIWLSLAVLGSLSSGVTNGPANVANQVLNKASTSNPILPGSPITSVDFFIGYVVAIGLLIGGMIVAKDYGGEVGKAAGWGVSTVTKGADWAKKKGAQGAKAVGRGTARVAAKSAKAVDQMALNGAGSRAIGTVKDNFNMKGLGKVKDKLSIGLGRVGKAAFGDDTEAGHRFIGNKQAADIRKAVNNEGKWVDPETKIVYKYNKAGIITAKGADLTGRKEEDEKLMPKVGTGKKRFAAKIKESKFGRRIDKGKLGADSSTLAIKQRAEKAKKEAEEDKAFKSEYENYTPSELATSLRSTTSAGRRRVMQKMLAKEGYTEDAFGEWMPDQAKILEKKKNQHLQDYQMDASGDFTDHQDNLRMATDYANLQVDLENFDWNDKDRVDALTTKSAMRLAMIDAGIWDKYINEYIPEDDRDTVEKDGQAIHNKSYESVENNKQILENFRKSLSIFGGNPVALKDVLDNTRKLRPDLIYNLDSKVDQAGLADEFKKGKIKLTELKVKHLDIDSLAKIQSAAKTGTGDERYRAAIKTIDKEGDKGFADKLAEASLINAQEIEVANPAPDSKEYQSALDYRKDFITLKGDLKRGITKEGQTNYDKEYLSNFLSQASAKDLSQIDVKSLTPELTQAVASAMTYSQLNGVNRIGDNQALVSELAQAMVEMHHVDAEKVEANITNKFAVNIEARQKNEAIMKLIKDSQARATNPALTNRVNDYDFINAIREAAQDKHFTTNKDGKYVATDELKDIFRQQGRLEAYTIKFSDENRIT